MKKPEQRFAWKANDVVVEDSQQSFDQRVMSDAEKAYFLKAQEQKR